LIPIEALESAYPGLFSVKTQRSNIEYYYTCTPFLPDYILGKDSSIERITYLDADLFFFSNPESVIRESEAGEIAIIAHRFAAKNQKLVTRGIYNVGWVSFRRSPKSLECLHWWRDKCLEWCFNRVEDSRFADQKYLDHWPEQFKGVVVIQNKGANLAPWNLGNYQIRATPEGVWVDNDRLVFFHFHGFKKLAAWLYSSNLSAYGTKLKEESRNAIFLPYIRALTDTSRQSPYSSGGAFRLELVKRTPPKSAEFSYKLQERCKAILCFARGLWPWEYIIYSEKENGLSK
jgi:hypothetical protein